MRHWLALGLLALAFNASAEEKCTADPLAGRALYLRGSFNSWNASDEQKFTWTCNRFEVVTRLTGEHAFKLGDEGWSADADFGRGTKSDQVALRGPEIKHRFNGVHRITLRMEPSKTQATLRIENCPAPASLGDTILFLRGSMNNWAAQDDYAFQYSCDAYYLNVKLDSAHDFKIGDASWKETSTFGHSPTGQLVTGAKGNIHLKFSGEHTLRLAFVNGKPQLSLGPKTFADPTRAA